MPFEKGNSLWMNRGTYSVSSWNGLDVTYTVDENGCWVCTSHAHTSKGYYQIKRNGRTYKLHRWMLMQTLGREIREGWLVCHRCNNRGCINPDHLYEGTALENSKDMLNAGTARGGRSCKT